MPILCVDPPQKSIFCGANFGCAVALDLQQKIAFPTFLSRTNGYAIFSWNL